MDQNKYFQTTSFYLAAFLLAKGEILEKVEKLNFNKLSFIYKSSDELYQSVRVFNFGENGDRKLLVDFKKTEAAIKQLKSLIYD